jgi:hypothetical protein
MNLVTRGIFVLGLFLAAGGISLMFVPEWTCSLVDLRPTGDTLWHRVCGTLMVDLAYYCVRAHGTSLGAAAAAHCSRRRSMSA